MSFYSHLNEGTITIILNATNSEQAEKISDDFLNRECTVNMAGSRALISLRWTNGYSSLEFWIKNARIMERQSGTEK